MFIVGAQREAILRLFMRYGVYRTSHMDDYQISLLGSRFHGSNDTYLLHIDSKQFVMRVVDPLSPDLDRSVEQYNHQLMSDAGLTWPFLLFDVSNGVMISEFFNGRVLEDVDKESPVLLDKVMECMSQLHHSVCLFRQGRPPLQAYQSMADPSSTLEYLAVLQGDRLVRALAGMERSYQPCHQDTILKNFVLVRDQVFLIDWEYAAMGDPYYDFADFAFQNDFIDNDDFIDYCALFLGDINQFNRDKFELFIQLSMLTWGLWYCRKGHRVKGESILTHVVEANKPWRGMSV